MVKGNPLLRGSINDVDQYSDMYQAISDEGPEYEHTPYGASKTADLNVQFSIDPSYGLTKERLGWYSNGVLFDNTFFTEENGKIRVKTGTSSGDIARLRSAFPGQYVSHSVCEPGLGARIPEKHLEFTDEGYVSLTHGEISFETAQWDDNQNSAITAHGISYESDAAYHQVRAGGEDVAKVKQKNWNIDPMDGSGPSGLKLRPEKGYVYQFIYTWYGEGGYILALQDPELQEIVPVHRYSALTSDNPSLDSPNLPVIVTVENKGVGDSLSALVGGMQFSVHGGKAKNSLTRNTIESRVGLDITTDAVTTDNAVDPFSEPGVPALAVRRKKSDIRARKGLRFNLESIFANVTSDIYVYIFDEYKEEAALTGQNFTEPVSRGTNAGESLLETDTVATDYTPQEAVVRGVLYISSSKNQAQNIAGTATSLVPLEATVVATAVLSPGANNTIADPILFKVSERY
jgi:hypothetical protein